MHKIQHFLILTLAVYLFGTASQINAQIGEKSKGDDSATLAGSWTQINKSEGRRTADGLFVPGVESKINYRFTGEGEANYLSVMNMPSSTGCNIRMEKLMRGKAQLKGNDLTIKWSRATAYRKDSCDESKSGEIQMAAETSIFKAQIKKSNGTQQLCLTSQNQTERCLLSDR